MTTLPPDLLSVFRAGKRTSYIFTFNLKEKKMPKDFYLYSIGLNRPLVPSVVRKIEETGSLSLPGHMDVPIKVIVNNCGMKGRINFWKIIYSSYS